MMTEEDAKNLWCPMTFSSGTGAMRCRGSDCMAWRRIAVPHVSDVNKDGTLVRIEEVQGYCGLAGPQKY